MAGRATRVTLDADVLTADPLAPPRRRRRALSEADLHSRNTEEAARRHKEDAARKRAATVHGVHLSSHPAFTTFSVDDCWEYAANLDLCEEQAERFVHAIAMMQAEQAKLYESPSSDRLTVEPPPESTSSAELTPPEPETTPPEPETTPPKPKSSPPPELTPCEATPPGAAAISTDDICLAGPREAKCSVPPRDRQASPARLPALRLPGATPARRVLRWLSPVARLSPLRNTSPHRMPDDKASRGEATPLPEGSAARSKAGRATATALLAPKGRVLRQSPLSQSESGLCSYARKE